MSLCPYFMVVKSQLRYEGKNGSCLVQYVFLFLFSVCVCFNLASECKMCAVPFSRLFALVCFGCILTYLEIRSIVFLVL